MAQQHNYDTNVRRSITVLKSPAELYQAWRQPENLIRFVAGTKSVDVLDDTHLKWVAEIPGLGPETWTMEITADHEDELISWRTTDNPRIDQEGSVRFLPAPHGLGTEVRLQVTSHVPGGPTTQAAAKLLGRSPEDYLARTLQDFKQLVETGEVATNQGPIGQPRITTGLAPKVAAAGGTVALFLTTLYLRARRAKR